jgi:hypothetical protein
MLPGVDQPQTVRVTLEFEQGSDPPCGRLLDGQAVYPFAGWLGLAAALEHVIGVGTLTRRGSPAPADGLARPNTPKYHGASVARTPLSAGTIVRITSHRAGHFTADVRRAARRGAARWGPEVAWS